MVKAVIASYGIVWSMKGRQAVRSEATAIVCGPHSSFVDPLVLVLIDDLPFAVSRSQTVGMPAIGSRYPILLQLSCYMFIWTFYALCSEDSKAVLRLSSTFITNMFCWLKKSPAMDSWSRQGFWVWIHCLEFPVFISTCLWWIMYGCYLMLMALLQSWHCCHNRYLCTEKIKTLGRRQSLNWKDELTQMANGRSFSSSQRAPQLMVRRWYHLNPEHSYQECQYNLCWSDTRMNG